MGSVATWVAQQADHLRLTYAAYHTGINDWFCLVLEANPTLEDLADTNFPRETFGDDPIFSELDSRLATGLIEKIGYDSTRPLCNRIDQERAKMRTMKNNSVLRGRQILWLVLDALKTHDEDDAYILAIRDLEAVPAPRDDGISKFSVDWVSEVHKVRARCPDRIISDSTVLSILLTKVRNCAPLRGEVEALLRLKGTEQYTHEQLIRWIKLYVDRERMEANQMQQQALQPQHNPVLSLGLAAGSRPGGDAQQAQNQSQQQAPPQQAQQLQPPTQQMQGQLQQAPSALQPPGSESSGPPRLTRTQRTQRAIQTQINQGIQQGIQEIKAMFQQQGAVAPSPQPVAQQTPPQNVLDPWATHLANRANSEAPPPRASGKGKGGGKGGKKGKDDYKPLDANAGGKSICPGYLSWTMSGASAAPVCPTPGNCPHWHPTLQGKGICGRFQLVESHPKTCTNSSCAFDHIAIGPVDAKTLSDQLAAKAAQRANAKATQAPPPVGSGSSAPPHGSH